MQQVLDAFPDVLIDHDNKHFYQGLLDKRLVLNRCADCGTWHGEPLRAICSQCHSWNIQPQAVSGNGSVYMLTLLHQGPAVEGVTYDPPLPLAVIELDEQKALRVSGKLIGGPSDPADLSAIGKRVRLVWPAGQIAPRLSFEIVEAA
ncbi:MAG: OB-fold domain-containing protein [Pseudomonadota bacterium]